jgi:hypothetical protein
MKPTIEIILAPTGELRIEAAGFQGADCEAATRFLEEALGVPAQRTRKPEYHARRTVHREQRLGG